MRRERQVEAVFGMKSFEFPLQGADAGSGNSAVPNSRVVAEPRSRRIVGCTHEDRAVTLRPEVQPR